MLNPDYRFEKAKFIFIYLTTYHSLMRFILLTNFLLLSAYSLFAQTNPFKDEKVQKEKAAQFITSHHISEIDQTLVAFKDGQVIDSSKTEDFYYDNKGRQSKTIIYSKGYSNAFPEGKDFNMITNYDYDKRHYHMLVIGFFNDISLFVVCIVFCFISRESIAFSIYQVVAFIVVIIRKSLAALPTLLTTKVATCYCVKPIILMENLWQLRGISIMRKMNW